MILPGMINQVWENIVQIHPWASSLSYPCFIKLPWLEVAPGDSICSAMRPCGLNLAILYLPLPSGFLSLLSVFAKWLHACIHVPSESSELQKKKSINAAKPKQREKEDGVGVVIMDTLFTHYSQYLIISHVKHPCSVPFKIPPKVREVDHFSLKRVSGVNKSHGQFPLKHGHGKKQK